MNRGPVVALAAFQPGPVLGPLFFSVVYFAACGSWPGLIWLVGAAIHLLALPLMLGIRRRVAAAL